MKSEVPPAGYRDCCVLRWDSYSLLDMYQCSERPDTSIFRKKERRQTMKVPDTWVPIYIKRQQPCCIPSFFCLINLRHKVKGTIDRLTETGRCYRMETNVGKKLPPLPPKPPHVLCGLRGCGKKLKSLESQGNYPQYRLWQIKSNWRMWECVN